MSSLTELNPMLLEYLRSTGSGPEEAVLVHVTGQQHGYYLTYRLTPSSDNRTLSVTNASLYAFLWERIERLTRIVGAI